MRSTSTRSSGLSIIMSKVYAPCIGMESPWTIERKSVAHDSATDEAVWNAQVSDSSENVSEYQQTLDLGRWNAEVSYGRPMFWIDPPTGNHPSSGGALIARLDDDEYLITALRARVTLSPSSEIEGLPYMIERVEEGHFDANGNWVFERVWNGDQADWGLNFTSQPHILKVKMATYKQ